MHIPDDDGRVTNSDTDICIVSFSLRSCPPSCCCFYRLLSVLSCLSPSPLCCATARLSLSSDISRLVRRRFLSVGSIECGAIARRYRCCNGNIGELAAKTAAVAACRVVVGATSASQLPPSPPPLRPFRRSNSSQVTTSVSEDRWHFSVLALQAAQLSRLVVLG